MKGKDQSHQGEEPQTRFEERKNEKRALVLFFGRSCFEIRPSAAMFDMNALFTFSATNCCLVFNKISIMKETCQREGEPSAMEL